MRVYKYIVTIFIILLATFGLFSLIVIYDPIRDATEHTNKANLENYRVALRKYKLDMGEYPSTEQGLSALLSIESNDSNKNNNLKPGYFSKLPKDPWGNPYHYRNFSSDGEGVIVWSERVGDSVISAVWVDSIK